MRLRVMAGFFRECSENPGLIAPAPTRSKRCSRTIVQEILLAMGEFGFDKREMTAVIRPADQALRRHSAPRAISYGRRNWKLVYPSATTSGGSMASPAA